MIHSNVEIYTDKKLINNSLLREWRRLLAPTPSIREGLYYKTTGSNKRKRLKTNVVHGNQLLRLPEINYERK